MVSLNEARAKGRPAGSWGGGENAAQPSGMRMVGSVQPEVARRRTDRDFHAERIRERNYWKNILLLIFLFVGAAAAFALMSVFNR